MGHWQDGDHLGACLICRREQHGAGTVFAAFFVTCLCFMAPEIRVANYEAGNWIGNLHSSGLDLVIEGSGFCRRSRRSNPSTISSGTSVNVKTSAIAPLEPLIFGGRHQHEAIVAMMRDGKGRNQRLAADAAEGL